MVFRLIFSALALLSFTSYGQKDKWQKVDQQDYGLKYELPKDWQIDGFGTSSVCRCSGSINSGYVSKNNSISMVFYPALSDSALRNGVRTEVWDWKFQENEARTNYSSKSLTFEKTVSKWTTTRTDIFDLEDDEVWRFTTSFKKQYYVIYFWADKKVLSKNEKLILEILNRMNAVNARSYSEYW